MPAKKRRKDRKAMDAIFYRLGTGCQWKALDVTGICSSSSAHRRFQEWTQAGVFRTLWAQGLLDYDALKGLDWEWQAMDGAMTKAPPGKEKTGPNPTDRAKRGVKRSLLVRIYSECSNDLGLHYAGIDTSIYSARDVG